MQSSASPAPSSSSSSSWRLRICPVKPFNDVPFLLSTSPSTSLLSLRERIAKVLQKYTNVKEEHVILFVQTDGVEFALLEDALISDLIQNGEMIEVRRDEALWARDTLQGDSKSMGKRMRQEDGDDEADILIEANRIAQKMKSEIGPRSRIYDEEDDLPLPPPGLNPLPPTSASTLPVVISAPSMGAASALQAFEQRKKEMQMQAAKRAKSIGRNTSQSSLASSSSVSSSSSGSSSSSSSDSSSSDSSSSSGSSDSGSSSSSSDDSSSSDSSSSSSKSEPQSKSDSDSDSSSGPPEASHIHQNGVRKQGWVPPGQGLARTQRTNRSRRQKRKAEEEENRLKLFQEAKERAEKRAKGEAVDEKAASEAWMVDRKGGMVNGQNAATQKYKVVSRDGPLVLPPGGGSLGIKQAEKAMKQSSGVPAAPTPEQEKGYVPPVREVPEMSVTAKGPVKREGASVSYSRVPPPPSQRNTAVPAGVRLTSIDCDDCYNGLETQNDVEEESEDVNELYKAWQAQAKASLQAAKDKEEREEREAVEQEERNERIAQKAHWLDESAPDDLDGDDSQYVDGCEDTNRGIETVEDEADLDMALSFMADLPIEFGKKSDWDGNDVVVPRQQQLLASGSGLLELDYGEPEDAIAPSTHVHKDLKRLRDLRDQALAAKGHSRPEQSNELKRARMIALASRKKAAAIAQRNRT